MKKDAQKDLRHKRKFHVKIILTEEDTLTTKTTTMTLKQEDKLLTNPPDGAKALGNQFRSVFTLSEPETKSSWGLTNHMLTINISNDCVLAHLLKLSQHKTTGPDDPIVSD